jgi:chemotaxis protein methyltransferase CheR
MNSMNTNGPLKLSEKEYTLFVELIYRTSGINLDANKKELLKTRFQKIMRKHGMSSYHAYYDYVRGDRSGEALSEMIDAISTNHTYFFRESQHFDLFRKTIFPQIIEKKIAQRSKKIRAWCAASSSGEEPYTITVCMLEAVRTSGWDMKLLATDISTKVLKKAVAGMYHPNQFKEMPKSLVDKYFEQDYSEGELCYRVRDEIRPFVVFRRFNLMLPQYPFKGKFDFIFCRNVMIYFDVETQQRVVAKMLDHLVDGGFLFIGHSENIIGNIRTRLKQLAPAVFQKT